MGCHSGCAQATTGSAEVYAVGHHVLWPFAPPQVLGASIPSKYDEQMMWPDRNKYTSHHLQPDIDATASDL
eukprot:9053645-Karenia_brevis.AAC.1